MAWWPFGKRSLDEESLVELEIGDVWVACEADKLLMSFKTPVSASKLRIHWFDEKWLVYTKETEPDDILVGRLNNVEFFYRIGEQEGVPEKTPNKMGFI